MSNSRCSLHYQVNAALLEVYFILQYFDVNLLATIEANNAADNILSPSAQSEFPLPILGQLAAASHFPSGNASIYQ